MTYTDDEIARMTPYQREAAQDELMREYLARTDDRKRRRQARQAGTLGGLAKAANRRSQE